MLKKLRLKFVLINMSIVVAMLLAIFATVYHFTKTDLQRQANSMLQSLAQSARQPNGPREPKREVQLPYFIIQVHLNGDLHVSGYTSYDLTDEAFLQELVQKVYSLNTNEGTLPEYALRYKAVPAMGSQKLIFLDISSHETTLSSLLQGSILIGLASIIVFLAISFWLARWAIKPVEKAWAQQRQFVSDASHELKTPLTVILGNAEMLQNPDYCPETKLQFAENIVTMSHRMRSLVEGLLELARADNGRIQQAFERLNMSQLTEDSLLPFEPLLFEKDLTLECSIEPGILLNGSATHLQQLLGILLDNAGKYACPGIVTVKLHRQGRSCILSVANPGEPIPEQELKRIFDRFYRTDTARTGNGSFGLGLSIAKSIVEQHKGKIWAQSNQTGNCFFVQLPTL